MIKKSLVMTITPGVLILIGLAVQHFLTKYLTQEQYGQYQLMLSWLAILSFFSLNSFNTIVTKASAQGYPRYIRTASLICFTCSLIGSAALLIIGWFFEKSLTELFIISAAFFPFYAGINLASAHYIGAGKFSAYSWVVILSETVSAISLIAAVWLSSDLKTVYWLAIGIPSLINLGLTIFLIRTIKQKPDRKTASELTKYGLQLTVINIIPTIASRIQYIVLAALAGPSTLAIYAVAQMFPEKMKAIFKSSLNPYSMYLASHDKIRSLRTVRKSLTLLFLLGIILTAAAALVLPIMIKIIFGQKYDASIHYSLLLMTTLVFLPINGIIMAVVVYHGYKRFYTKLTTITSVLQIALFSLLVPGLEIYGIVIAVVMMAAGTTVFSLVWLYRQPLPETKKILLSMSQQDRPGYETRLITRSLSGDSVIKVIEADYLSKQETYPWWARLVAIFSFTKYI